MKKLITFIMLATACITAKAQYSSLNIINNSSCDVEVVLYGTTNGSGCLADYKTYNIPIPAFGSLPMADPTHSPQPLDDGSGNLLGLTDKFTMVRVLHGDPTLMCTTAGTADMSDCIPGASTSVMGFAVESGSLCGFCTNINITWSVVAGVVTLTFL